MINNSSAARLAEIKNLLAGHPRGLSINEIASGLKRHRNSVSRDLHALSLSGQVIQHAFGTTRIYSLTKRPPISRILEYTSDMALIIDRNGIVVNANAPFLAFFSCGPGSVEGQCIHTDAHPLFSAISARLKNDVPQGVFSESTCTVNSEEGIFHLKMRIIPTVFEDGTSGSVIMIEDLTRELRAHDALERSETLYRAIVDTMTEMIIRFLPDGTVIFTNPAYASYMPHDTIRNGKESFFSRVHPGDLKTLQSSLAALSPDNPLTSLSFRILGEGGVPAWNTWTIHGIFGHEGQVLGYQGLGRDITPEIESREQEALHAKELEFIASKCRDLHLLTNREEIYECIACHLEEMIREGMIAVYSTNPSGSVFTLKALAGAVTPGEKENFRVPDAISQSCSPEERDPGFVEIRRSLLRGSLVDTGGYLYDSLCRQHCPGQYKDLKNVIDGVTGLSAGFVWEGSLLGAVEIFTRTVPLPEKRLFIESYLTIASLALQQLKTEESLHIRKEQLMTIANTNPLPMAIIDQQGRYQFVSPMFTRLFGYTLEDIPTGREWFMQAFPDLADQKLARESWKKDLAESLPGQVRARQYRVRCKDGLFKEVSFLAVSMSDSQNLVVYEDVTPRLEAAQTRNLLFDIIRSSHDGIFSATIDGRILSWNPAAERIYGYSAEEVEGRDVRMLEPPHLKGEISLILKRVRHGEYIAQHETQRVRKDGRTIDVSLTISPVYEECGYIIGASTIVRDITAQKAEERLRKTEMKYKGLVDNINVGVYRSTGDPGGRFIWGNTSLLRILGYDTVEDLQEIQIRDIFSRSGGRDELLSELRENGFVKNREILLKRTDGTLIHVLVTALATFSPEGSISHINGIVEDITGQRLLEQKMARQKLE